ncbi:MAG: TetR/AcrR family transcriptional regulator [Rhodobacteraceae bacterium]|nr:TetR/AcrR family transcriptional regulator [Paracoccaceae bacterium]
MTADGRLEHETAAAEPAAPDCCAPEADAGPWAQPVVSRKCEQLLDGARAVILARGFEGSSVDDIAREAGISKATMYRYYPDKSALFAAVMHRDCSRQSTALEGIEVEGRTLEAILTELCAVYVEFVSTPCAQGIFRSAVSESKRFPEIGQAFYASGPERGRAWLVPLLVAAAERGEIEVEDADLAAHRFFALCQAEVYFKRLFGIVEGYDAAEIAAHSADTAKAFLRMYRPA